MSVWDSIHLTNTCLFKTNLEYDCQIHTGQFQTNEVFDELQTGPPHCLIDIPNHGRIIFLGMHLYVTLLAWQNVILVWSGIYLWNPSHKSTDLSNKNILVTSAYCYKSSIFVRNGVFQLRMDNFFKERSLFKEWTHF